MGKIDELIQQYCPEGVEYVSIGSLITRVRDKGKNNPSVKTVYSVSNTLGLVKAEDFRDNVIYSEDTSNYVVVEQGMFAYNPARLNIGSLAYLQNNQPGLVSPMYVVFDIDKSKILPEYLYLYLKSPYIIGKINSLTESGARFRFDFERWGLIEIPLPPLPVQEAIVNILDRFAVYAAELQAELQARQQQYNYYRDTLLSFEGREDVKEFSVGEIATFTYGYTTKANDEGDIRYIRITDINEQGCLNSSDGKFIYQSPEVEPYLLRKGDLVMARTGATYGKTLYYNEEYPSAYASFLIKISFNDLVNPRYYWHFSKSIKYWEQARRLVGGGAQPQFNTGAISQVKITLPSLAEQQRIVDILDRFDRLINDLSQGLPAEIEARQQQYEYYRDKLLTFKRK